MNEMDEKIELLMQLISRVRLTMKTASPDAVIFAAEILRDLERHRAELDQQSELTLHGKAVAA